MGKKEEITDLMSPAAFEAKNADDTWVFKKNTVLRFKLEDDVTTIKITKIDRKNKRAWGEHIELHNNQIVVSHTGHNVDSTGDALEKYRSPFCNDCQLPVTEPSTEDGDKKALDRRDNQLADGTPIA